MPHNHWLEALIQPNIEEALVLCAGTKGRLTLSRAHDLICPSSLMNDHKIDTPHATNAYPTTLADLQLTPQPFQGNFYKSLDEIRKSTLSISNRINSILEDAEFVERLYAFLCESRSLPGDAVVGAADTVWPLVPNERSGSWPLDPHLKIKSQQSFLDLQSHRSEVSGLNSVSAYFKSTDGHINHWAFSTRRLNLPMLDLLGHANGAVIVDTTRRGKRYPDALRRTVPIWCAVWNRVLFPEMIATGIDDFQECNLDISEVNQIERRLPQFTDDLRALRLNIADLRVKCKRPIRCVWVHAPEVSGLKTSLRSLGDSISIERSKWRARDLDVNILVCCSASRPVYGAEGDGTGYIQGAGDDAEAWSHGLNARLFWQHKDELLTAMNGGEENLQILVESLVAKDKEMGQDVTATRIGNSNVFIGARGVAHSQPAELSSSAYHVTIDCNASAAPVLPSDSSQCVDYATPSLSVERSKSRSQLLALNLKEGKSGSKHLDSEITKLLAHLAKMVKDHSEIEVLVVCSSGRDLSVGVALALICGLCDASGNWLGLDHGLINNVNKTFIRQRLAWITSSKPDANPSRATLQAVNRALMS